MHLKIISSLFGYCVSIKLISSLLSAAIMPASLTGLISANANNIPILNGANFKDWKENMLIVLGCMDLDLALRTEQPPSLTPASTPDQRKDFEKWERSN